MFTRSALWRRGRHPFLDAGSAPIQHSTIFLAVTDGDTSTAVLAV